MKNNPQKPKRGGARPGAGRKKGSPNKTTAEVAALAQEYGAQAIEKLWSIADTSESDAAKVSAIKELLDRAYGKSKQSVDATINGNLTILTKEQRDAAFSGALRADT